MKPVTMWRKGRRRDGRVDKEGEGEGRRRRECGGRREKLHEIRVGEVNIREGGRGER